MHIPTTALELHWQLVVREVVTSCLTCDCFAEDTEICSLAMARPPARVIVIGCTKWVPQIPF